VWTVSSGRSKQFRLLDLHNLAFGVRHGKIDDDEASCRHANVEGTCLDQTDFILRSLGHELFGGIKELRNMRVFIVYLCFLSQVISFTPSRHTEKSRSWLLATRRSSEAEWYDATLSRGNHLATTAGFLSGAISLVPRVLAETEVEMADLPPTYIPVLFGLGLLVVSLCLRGILL
jgi:hypothetical protein